ncbi:MAG: MBOAT family protein [Myxococcales bacterium]|nr:MAG: MBOAT family protein [Myxococcales bacterium]
MGVTSGAFWLVTIVGLLGVVPLTKSRHRDAALAALNLAFLALVQGPWLAASLALLLGSYAAVTMLDRARPSASKWFTAATCAALALFAAFKAPAIAGLLPPALSVWLSALGYSYVALRFIDELAVVRDEGGAPTFAQHLNYLVPFHMLAAGPIQAFSDFRGEGAVAAPLTFDQALAACERIGLGLFKKLVLAHALERLFLTGFRSEGLYYFIEVQLFLPWLYLDFSSYSDIAVGVGRLLGVRTPENFDRPYLARDLVDFWQRWHISLSQWIRRNVFMPLQMLLQRRLPEVSSLRTSSMTLLVAFGLCGLWHMVSVRYALWGLMHACGVVAANASQVLYVKRHGRAAYVAYRKRPLPRLIGIVLTFEFVAWSLSIVAGQP